ncbi:Hypothetical protein A7982_10524 [Minicystis rosea]|nr:Hypothetical protein A7982_10524 [Minicystis rosea]
MSTAGTSGYDLLYLKFESNGKVALAKNFGNGNDQDPLAMAIDGSGRILFAGNVVGTLDLDGTTLMTAGDGDRNTFLAKYAGSMSIYARQWGDAAIDSASAVAADQESNVILAGGVLGTINFGGADISNLGTGTPYLVKLDSGAKHIWSKGFGDATTTLQADSLAAVDSSSGEIVFGSTFKGTLDLGRDKLTANTRGFAVAKFNP